MTSPVEFPEEQPVPPVIQNTPGFPIGSILEFNKNSPDRDLRLPISVKDDNVNDMLEVRAQLSVVGQSPYSYECGPDKIIAPGVEPQRELFELVIDPNKLKDGACTLVEVYVSSEFAYGCDDQRQTFLVPSHKNDLASARFWIWETSGLVAGTQTAAQDLVTSCQTVTRAQASSTAMVP